jgi:hypothetical protein
MPNLPTLTVTEEQADRLLAVFGSVDAYKEWLKTTLINYVVSQEAAQKMDTIQSEAQADREALFNQI